MSTENILRHADSLFEEDKPQEAQQYLSEVAHQAIAEDNLETALVVLNELTGYYRRVKDFPAGWDCAEKIITLIDEHDLWDTTDAATSLLNIATLFKDSGKPRNALNLYLQLEPILQRNGVQDFRLVGLYNNISVTFLECGLDEDARIYSEKAYELSGKVNMKPRHLESVRSNFDAAHQKDNHHDTK